MAGAGMWGGAGESWGAEGVGGGAVAQKSLLLHDTKGGRPRVTMLPAAVVEPLRAHLQAVRRLHGADVRRGAGVVELPGALADKYPGAGREWAWQWAFPAARCYVARDGSRRRHHVCTRARSSAR
jgi:hypothetical protein